MKNLLNLRNNKMNNILRSTLASSLIALTMMSCTKENIEPASVNSLENSRMRSNLATDNDANQVVSFESAANNDQALIDITIETAANEASYKIIISRNALVNISRIGERENQFNQYRLDPDQFTHLLDFITTFHTSSQDFTSSSTNQNQLSASEVEYRSCFSCDPTALSSNGDAQERRAFTSMINEVDRIIDLQSLLNLHISNGTRN